MALRAVKGVTVRSPLFLVCLGLMLTRRQINQLVIEFNRKGNLSMSAMKAGVTRKTAGK